MTAPDFDLDIDEAEPARGNGHGAIDWSNVTFDDDEPVEPSPFDIGMPLDLRSALAGREYTEWFVIDPIIPEGCATVLFSEGGRGKSFVAQHVAVALASGQETFPSLRVECPVMVLLLDAENTRANVARRIREIAKFHNLTPEALASLQKNLRIHVQQFMPWISKDGEPTEGFDAVYDLVGAMKEKPNLIVLDSLMAFAGAGETNNQAVDRFFNLVDRLICLEEEGGMGVLVLHHTTKGGGKNIRDTLRGAGRVWDRPRSVLYLDQRQTKSKNPDADNIVTLTHVKSNMGALYHPVHLRFTGGALQEVDPGRSAPILRSEMLGRVAIRLGELLAEVGGLSPRELAKTEAGHSICSTLRREFRVTQSGIDSAVRIGIDTGVLKQVQAAVRGPKKTLLVSGTEYGENV